MEGRLRSEYLFQMLRGVHDMAVQGVGDVGQQLRLDAHGGVAVLHAMKMPSRNTLPQCHSPRRVSSRDKAPEDMAGAT